MQKIKLQDWTDRCQVCISFNVYVFFHRQFLYCIKKTVKMLMLGGGEQGGRTLTTMKDKAS